jgi:hypothetical protein
MEGIRILYGGESLEKVTLLVNYGIVLTSVWHSVLVFTTLTATLVCLSHDSNFLVLTFMSFTYGVKCGNFSFPRHGDYLPRKLNYVES